MSDLEPITQEETAWANGDLEPITRKEQYLNRLTGEEQAIPETPITRTEQYLAKLCGVETEIPGSPITREEAYLAYLNGENVTLPEPITRLEQFMAFAAGESETKPTPLTREEFYWDKYQGGAVLKDFPGLPSSIVTVTDALAKPLDSLKVAITPVQSGSGDPSPDNIRPISGWTGANISIGGENIYNQNDITASGGGRVTVTAIGDNALRVSTGTNGVSYAASIQQLSNYNLEPNARYVVKATVHVVSGVPHMGIRNSTTNTFITSAGEIHDGVNYFEFTTPSVGAYLSFLATWTSNSVGDVYYRDITISKINKTYQITFPSEAGTVYGGTLDVVNGTLTVDRQFHTFDGSENWILITSTSGTPYVCINLGSKQIYKNDTENVSYSLFSHYKTVPITTSDENTGARVLFSTSQKKQRICIRQEIGMTVTELKTYFAEQYSAGTPVQCCAVLLEPITYQLTPTEVQMLLGTNNIWADTGDILEGKYWGKKSSATRAMLSTLQDAGEITPTEEPEENADER